MYNNKCSVKKSNEKIAEMKYYNHCIAKIWKQVLDNKKE